MQDVALIAGALYFNTTDEVMKLYTGSAWVAAYVSGADYLARANNLSDLTDADAARVNIGSETSTTGSAKLPAGTTAQRDVTPAAGFLRFNTTDGGFEGYDGSAWGAVGGGNTAVVGWENQITVAENYTITTGNNMMSAGPVTIDTGFTVTVPTGSRWVVV